MGVFTSKNKSIKLDNGFFARAIYILIAKLLSLIFDLKEIASIVAPRFAKRSPIGGSGITKSKLYLLNILFVVGILILVNSTKGYSQVLIPFSGSNSISAGTNTTLCTHAGCGSTYSASANGYTVINGMAGANISISGTYYTEANYDYVRIYDGSGIGGTLLATYTASSSTAFTYTATAGQTITVQFTSDGSVQNTGLDATVSYTLSVPYSGSNSYTTCSAHLYDNGGPAAAYAASSDGYSVIYPSNASQAVQLTGTFDTESGFEHIYIYDGAGIGGTLLYNGGSGAGNIGTIVSSGVNIPLTVRFTSDGSIQNSGFDFTISCVSPPLPGENCSNAQDLTTLTSPFSGTTTGYADDISTCRTGYPDRMFYIDVPNNYNVDIWQSVNDYDSYHYMGYGASCPGTQIYCVDDADTQNNPWVNTTGSTQRVWFIVDGYNGSGNFTLNWTLVAACNAPTSITANASSATVCPNGSVTYQYSTSSGGYCLGGNNWEYQWENTSGGVVRAWSTTANYTTTIASSTTYRLRMRCSGCASSTALSNDVTVNVYSVSATTPTLSSPANISAVTSTPTTLSWSGSMGNHPSSSYEVQVNGGAWTSTGSTTSYSAGLNIGANTWAVRYYDGCSGAYYTSGSWTVYYTPVSSCGNIDHGGTNWTISSNITVSGNHINIGTFTINNGITATVDAGCHYFNVEANIINVFGVINGNGAGNAGGNGGNGGVLAFNSPDYYCNGGFGGSAGTAGQGVGGGAAGTNGGNATCVDQICGGLFCIGNKDGHDGGGGGAGGGAGGSYGGTGASGAVAARGCSGNGATGGSYGSGGAASATYGTTTGTDISWGSGGAGGGGGGGAFTNGSAGGAGGAGGGQVSLKAAQTFTLSGSVTCNGTNGGVGGNASGESADNSYDCSSSGYNECSICPQESFDYAGGAGGAGGAGSGGGILIQSCGSLSFTGSLQANGGTGGSAGLPNTNHGTCFDWAAGGAAGGGGRIKIFRNPCETNTISGSTVANSGSGGTSTDGHTGNTGSAGSIQTALNHPSYIALNAGTIGTAQTVCTGGDLAAFTNTASPSGGNCAQTYTYQWMKCTSGCGSAPTGYTDISGANAITFDEGIITQTTYYIRKVTSGNCTAYTPSIVATVVPDPVTPTATKSPNTATVCEGQTLTLITPVDNGGGTGSCQINYRYASTLAGLASAGWSTSIPSTTAVSGNFYIEMQKVCSGTGCDASPITQYSWVVNSNSTAPTSITGTTTICNGSSTTLTVNGGSLGTGASWKWYSGSCGGTSAGTGTSITVSPSANTTYYVRAEGTCNSTSCVSTSVTVNTPSTAPTSITGTTTICNGSSTTLTTSGGSLGTDATNVWYAGSCGTDAYNQPWTNQPFGVGGTNVNSVAGGILNVTSTNGDPMILMGGLGSFDPTIYKYIQIRYRVTAGTAGNAELFFYNTAHNWAVGGETGYGTLISDGAWHVVNVDMSADPDYTTGGNILGWRFDWATASGVTMDIDYISLSNTQIIGEGNSISVSPTSSTTYYTSKKGACNTTSCASTTVTVNSLSTAPTSITGTTTICNGSSTTLTVNGGSLGTGASWKWYSGSCGGTSVGSGASISVSPSANTTYYVRAEGTCNNTSCVSTSVTVNSLSTPATSISITNNSTCGATSKTLTLVGGSLGTGATWKWYSGSCGGTSVGAGTSITVSPSANTTYYVRAEGTCNNTACVSATVTVIAAPANDLCANATSIGALPYSSGVQSNNCATNDAPAAGSSSCGVHDYNVWYKFTGNGNQINISTCDGLTTFDTELHVFTGSCGSMTEVICSDDGIDAGCSSGRSSLTMCTTNGTTYYISVGSYILGAVTGNYVLNITDKAIGVATITPNSICGNGTVTLTANVGANADVVDFSIDGGSSVASSDASSPYQYTTATLTAPQSVTVYVRSKNSVSGCVGTWTNSAVANAYAIPTITVQPLCNNTTGGKIEIIASGGSGTYSNYEQQSPAVTQASNIFSVPYSSNYSFRVNDNHGCASSWASHAAPVGPSQIAGISTGNCIVRGQNDWWHITDASNQVIVSIQDNSNNLGSINAWSYIEPTTTFYNESYYLKRHFKITSQNTPSSNVTLRLYFNDAELNELIVKSKLNANHSDDVNDMTNLRVTRYSGINEDNNYANNNFGCGSCFTVYDPNTGAATGLGSDVKYVELSVPGFSEEWIHGGINTTSILPIELLTFKPECLGSDAIIRWVTASETNNSHFMLQRSIDGVHYQQIAQIQGSGNSSELTEYSYIDTQKPEGIVYYRLNQVDYNGTETTFDAKSLNCKNNEETLNVIPNPFRNNISILGLSTAQTRIDIFNAEGANVYSNMIDKSNSQNINLEFLKPGIYLLKLIDKNGEIHQFKLVKN